MREICTKCSQEVKDRTWKMLLPGVSFVRCQCELILRLRQLGRVYSLQEMLSLDRGDASDATHWDGLDFVGSIAWQRITPIRTTSSLPPKIARKWAQLALLQEISLAEDVDFNLFWTRGGEHTRAMMVAVCGTIAGYLIWIDPHEDQQGYIRRKYPALWQIYVRPEFRRQRVATRMIQYWVKHSVIPSSCEFTVTQPNVYTLEVLAVCGFHHPDQNRGCYTVTRQKPNGAI